MLAVKIRQSEHSPEVYFSPWIPLQHTETVWRRSLRPKPHIASFRGNIPGKEEEGNERREDGHSQFRNQ